MDGDVVLQGGIANAGAVVRRGEHVLRPSNPNTPTIHALLRHLRANGFEGASEPVGVDPDGRERLVFIPGDVGVPPYPAWAQTDLTLASAAALMRRMHDACVGFVPPDDAAWSTEMADPTGATEVICHNDICVENIVYRNEVAVGFLDFDFAAPGRRVHDLALFAGMCVPLDADDDAIRLGRTPRDPFRRVRIVADAYGLTAARRPELLAAIAAGISRGGQFLQRRLDEGNEDFRRMVESAGGMARFDRRRAWFAANHEAFATALA